MSLSRSACSPMNFVLMRVEIQPSVATSPVLLAPSFVLSATLPPTSFDFAPTLPAVPVTFPFASPRVVRLFSTRVTPGTCASRSAFALSALVATMPLNVTTPPSTDTLIASVLSVGSSAIRFAITVSRSRSWAVTVALREAVCAAAGTGESDVASAADATAAKMLSFIYNLRRSRQQAADQRERSERRSAKAFALHDAVALRRSREHLTVVPIPGALEPFFRIVTALQQEELGHLGIAPFHLIPTRP